MKYLVIVGITSLALFGMYATGIWMLTSTEKPSYSQEKTEPLSKYEVGPPDAQEMLELVNKERSKVGVAPLTIDQNVQKAAQLKADDMSSRGYFSHIVKGSNYTLTTEMANYIDQSCTSSSENIQITEKGTSQDAFDWWKKSEPHYKAMMSDKYTRTGFGVSYDQHVGHNEIDSNLVASTGDFNDAYISVQHLCVAK